MQRTWISATSNPTKRVSRRAWSYLALSCALAFLVLTVPILLDRDWPGEWQIVEWALGARSPLWTAVMQAVTFAGSSAAGLGLSVGASIVQVLHGRRLLSARAWLPAAALLSSAPVNFLLRAVCGRLRPGVEYIPHRMPELAHPFQRWSYPSGHAMTATICYGALVYLFVRLFPRWRYAGLAILAVWLVVVGFSRVYLGVHWPTDVLGGYLLGGAWLFLWIALVSRRPASHS